MLDSSMSLPSAMTDVPMGEWTYFSPLELKQAVCHLVLAKTAQRRNAHCFLDPQLPARKQLKQPAAG